VYKTDLTGLAPAAVEQFTLAPGKTNDVEAEAGSFWGKTAALPPLFCPKLRLARM